MLDFTSPPFAIAGLLAAAGPVIVHLLNRRRHRVVAWGPMDFLREALQRQRKTLELRDVILLALRMLALIALGLGLARPFWRGASATGPVVTVLLGLAIVGGVVALATAVIRRRMSAAVWCGLAGALVAQTIPFLWPRTTSATSATAVDSTASGAVHAILLIDNSRSMGVATAAGTALDRALAQARRFVDQLPADSLISLIPLAGSLDIFPLDPFAGREEARRALEQIRLVDAAADLAAGLEQAERTGRQTPELPAKRVVIWSDLQQATWADVDWPAWSQRLPDVQIAPLVEQSARNLAVTSLILEDGFAGAEFPARFLVRVSASPALTAPAAAEVLLMFDDQSAGSQLVELSPGQTRELEFTHAFDVAGEPGRPNWVTATVDLQPADPEADQLSADNRLSITIPVVDTVPVVFVDQHGSDEDLSRNRIGETHALRHLLSPKTAATDAVRRTVQIQHVTPDEVTQQLLEPARLVVVAGVESPESMTRLLREYVEQGGPLMILAGGDFDPEAWQADGWQDGRGLLPAKLLPEPLGSLPESSGELRPFFADFRSLQNDWFLVEGEDPDTLRGLFETVPFFQAVQFDLDQPAAEDEISDDPDAPRWWLWRNTLQTATRRSAAPRVLAEFTDGRTPWVIEQRIGRGRLVWFTSGVSSDWNLLRTSSAMYVFHRLMTRLMSETLPARNFTTGDRIAFPLPAAAQRYQLSRPGGVTEALTPEAIDADVTGLLIRRPLTAGPYQLRSLTGTIDAVAKPAETAELRFAVQPPAGESDLTAMSPDELRTAVATLPIAVLNVDELPRVTGGVVRGQSLWRWLLTAMLVALLAEMVIVGAPVWRRRPA